MWIAAVNSMRMVNQTQYFNIPNIDIILFILSCYLSWLIASQLVLVLRQNRSNFFDREQISKVSIIVCLSLLIIIGIFFTESFINIFLKIVSDQNELGLYGLRNSDFTIHLGISKYLLKNPILDSNPFYGAASFYYYSYFDLWVASIARIFAMPVNSVFLLVMPIISFICVIALFNVGAARLTFYSKLSLVFPSYLIFQEFITYPYNALALIYGAFFILIFTLWDKFYLNLDIKNPPLKFISSYVLMLCLVSVFVSQLKFLIWLAIYLGLMSRILFEFIRTKFEIKFLLKIFILIFIISSPLIWLVIYYSKNPQSYVFKLTQPFPLIFTTELVLILFFTILIFITLLTCKKCIFRYFELIFILCGIVFGSVLIMFSFRPLINDGGAIYAYPLSAMRVAFYFLFILFIYDLGTIFYQKFKIIKSIIFLFLLVYIPFLIWGGGRLAWLYPNSGWGKVSYVTSPNVEILDLIRIINDSAEQGNLVLTNYADLDRYYSFSTFSEFSPFLSSSLYAGISSQKDFELRRRIYDSLFKDRDIYLFSKLISYYPSTKFLLIDNSIAFQSTPPAELYLAYGGSKISSIYSIIDKNKITDDKWSYFPTEKYYERDFGNGFILKVFDFQDALNSALELGVLKLVKSNKSGALYVIEGTP